MNDAVLQIQNISKPVITDIEKCTDSFFDLIKSIAKTLLDANIISTQTYNIIIASSEGLAELIKKIIDSVFIENNTKIK
ncbi:hypothetical protein [Xenorhabdus bharatensis]|uniref:hypothetical protein n=1 Tax=Xenorhabdus bharatensis TaxID=3136256 RepID=UPI0030F47459